MKLPHSEGYTYGDSFVLSVSYHCLSNGGWYICDSM